MRRIKDDYLCIGAVTGAVFSVLIFFCSWGYCVAQYGYLVGVGLGWLPSIIVAVLGGVTTFILWPLLAAAALVGALIVVMGIDTTPGAKWLMMGGLLVTCIICGILAPMFQFDRGVRALSNRLTKRSH